jgi:hypothetical protein
MRSLIRRNKMSRPFVEFPERRGEEFTPFVRPKYLRFVEGSPLIVRILDKTAYSVDKHWIQKVNTSVICLGEQCPICKHNEELRAESPNTFRRSKGYIGINRRYMVNVLDRTPVLKDTETGIEYYASKGKFPTIDSSGEKSLVGLEPESSNTIKILERGRELFEQLSMIHNETIKVEDDVETGGLTSFDVKLVTMGRGKDTVITVMPMLTSDDNVESILEKEGLEPHILSTVGILLSPDEMVDLTRGISLKDIFAKRRAEEEIAETSAEVQGTLADVSDRVKALYGDDVERDED